MSFRPLDAKAPALLLRELKPLRDLLHSAEQLNRLQQLLDGQLQPQQAVAALMGRGPAAEGFLSRLARRHTLGDVGHGFFHLVHQDQTQLAFG